MDIEEKLTATAVLKKYFGYESFRPGQEEIIEAILSGRDNLAVMPTGAGKSLCYQVPAMILPGITLVISPLISLMQDQVKALNQAGIHAAYINSSLSEIQISKALDLARMGYYKIIYVAPERLLNENFLWFATGTDISMVTVDEAHCISQWGQDFRPSYVKILEFIEKLQKRPVISAFTATATEEVKTDIIFTLKLQNPLVTMTGFDRPNLFFTVEQIRKKDDYVVEYVKKHEGESGIIYCATRKNTDKVKELLDAAGLSVTEYHAGLGTLERKENQNDFIYDRKQVVVATNAFGMGIDKSNVRYVIHYNMPQSMENYYQEAGRAGRDGEPSECILLFSPQDVIIDRMLLERKDFAEVDPETEADLRSRDLHRLRVMEDYCRTTGCLRNYILTYFGENPQEPCGHCGNCTRTFQELDVTDAAKQVINCVFETKGRYGIGVTVGTLMGAKRAKLTEFGTTGYRTYGALKDLPEARIREIIEMLKEEKYLCQTEDRYSLLQMGQGISRLKDPDNRLYLRVCEVKEPEKNTVRKASGPASDQLTSLGFELLGRLKQLRTEIAREEAVPPYIVFSDKTLIFMCIQAPQDRSGMLAVSGVGEHKYEKYGVRFLDRISEFKTEHPDGILHLAPENNQGTDGKDRSPVQKESVKRSKTKQDFYLTEEQAAGFEPTELSEPAEIKEKLNALSDESLVKKITIKAFNQFLAGEDLLEEIIDGKFESFTVTEKGRKAGIQVEIRTAQSGREYQVLKYPENIQKLILEHYVKYKNTPGVKR